MNAFDVYEQWRKLQTPATIAAAAILISEGVDAAPLPPTGRPSEIAQLSADIRAGTEAQAKAMQSTQDARNQDRAALHGLRLLARDD